RPNADWRECARSPGSVRRDWRRVRNAAPRNRKRFEFSTASWDRYGLRAAPGWAQFFGGRKRIDKNGEASLEFAPAANTTFDEQRPAHGIVRRNERVHRTRRNREFRFRFERFAGLDVELAAAEEDRSIDV